MINLDPVFQSALTIFGFAGVVAVLWVGLRSRLPAETIRIQGENIAALQERAKESLDLIKELTHKVTKLEAENALLKEIPLGNIEATQQKILHLLEVQNQILSKIAGNGVAAATQVNVAK